MNNRHASTPSATWTRLATLSALLLVGCVGYNAPRQPTPTPVTSPPTAFSNQKAAPGAAGNFSTGVVCSLPRQAFPGTRFANLGTAHTPGRLAGGDEKTGVLFAGGAETTAPMVSAGVRHADGSGWRTGWADLGLPWVVALPPTVALRLINQSFSNPAHYQPGGM